LPCCFINIIINGSQALTQSYTISIVGIPSSLKETRTTAQNTEVDKRAKIHALSLAKEYYSMKLELLTEATVVNDVIRFVLYYSSNKKKLIPKKTMMIRNLKKRLTIMMNIQN
jgi:hypothetical protein